MERLIKESILMRKENLRLTSSMTSLPIIMYWERWWLFLYFAQAWYIEKLLLNDIIITVFFLVNAKLYLKMFATGFFLDLLMMTKFECRNIPKR